MQGIADRDSRESASALRETRRRLDCLLTLAVEYYWEQDPSQRFVNVLFPPEGDNTRRTARFIGCTFWELEEVAMSSAIVWQRYRSLFDARQPIRDLVIWRHDEQHGIHYSCISAVPVYDDSDDFRGYAGVVRDVTAEKRNEDHASSLELAAIGIGHVSSTGRFIHANRKLCEMLGYTREELLSLTVKQISHPEDENITDDIRSNLLDGSIDSFKCEKRYICKGGRAMWVGLTIAVKRGMYGQPLYDISMVEDISARKEAEERVQYLATHDEMTGLPNRVLFNQMLRHTLESSRRYRRQFALLFIDLDRFKQINDSLGHAAGDVLLKEMSDRFRNCLRASDVVARLGGDEFVVLVQEIEHRQQVISAARAILNAALQPVEILGQECRVTASIGVSVFPGDGDDEQTMMKNADIAMYQAKEEGRNNFQFYNRQIKSHTIEKLALESQLRSAIDNEEFELYYQPKVSVRTGEIEGVEALLRWFSPDLGQVPPSQFIPLAEELGVIVPLGLWVMRRACEQSRLWREQGLRPVAVSVNLSPRQFSDPALVRTIRDILVETGMDPVWLELEITESMVMHDADRALHKLQQIKQLGIRIAIDDFGTGYSSLSQLKRFPVDTLKVDRSFIREIQTVEEDRAITQAIITMGKTLGLTVVAEGVENAEQQSFLCRNDCDQIQGYHFSRPVPPAEFGELLRRYRPRPLD